MTLIYSVVVGEIDELDFLACEDILSCDDFVSLEAAERHIQNNQLFEHSICRIEITGYKAA